MVESREIAPGITVNKPKGFGKPVIRGTGVEVAVILDRLASGESPAVLKSELGATDEGFCAALAYAAGIADQQPASRQDAAREVSPGITMDGRVRFGRAVIKGTRMDAATVLHQLAAGASIDEVVDEYRLPRKGVLDVLRYAHQLIAQETVSAQ